MHRASEHSVKKDSLTTVPQYYIYTQSVSGGIVNILEVVVWTIPRK